MEIERRVEGGERREVWSCREEREWRGLKMQQQNEAICGGLNRHKLSSHVFVRTLSAAICGGLMSRAFVRIAIRDSAICCGLNPHKRCRVLLCELQFALVNANCKTT